MVEVSIDKAKWVHTRAISLLLLCESCSNKKRALREIITRLSQSLVVLNVVSPLKYSYKVRPFLIVHGVQMMQHLVGRLSYMLAEGPRLNSAKFLCAGSCIHQLK